MMTDPEYPTPDQTLPDPPFDVQPHWSIPVLTILFLCLVVVGWVVFLVYAKIGA